MSEQKSGSGCSCTSASTLVFPCSGGSDVGALADRVGRYMTLAGTGKMSCLAGVGGRVASFVKGAAAADHVLAIDGCPVGCAAKCLREAGIEDFTHLMLKDEGFKKGESPLTDESVRILAEKAAKLVEGSPACDCGGRCGG